MRPLYNLVFNPPWQCYLIMDRLWCSARLPQERTEPDFRSREFSPEAHSLRGDIMKDVQLRCPTFWEPMPFPLGNAGRSPATPQGTCLYFILSPYRLQTPTRFSFERHPPTPQPTLCTLFPLPVYPLPADPYSSLRLAVPHLTKGFFHSGLSTSSFGLSETSSAHSPPPPRSMIFPCDASSVTVGVYTTSGDKQDSFLGDAVRVVGVISVPLHVMELPRRVGPS